MIEWWESLTDAEIRARLMNRGVERGEADRLVEVRDGSWQARARITEVLGAL